MEKWLIILIIVGGGALAYLILHFLLNYLEKPKHPQTARTVDILGAVFLILVLIAGCFYLFVLSPSFVEKPYVEKIALNVNNASTKEEVITKEHIRYLANEIGAYKLHDDPLSKTAPEFEFVVEDFNRTYTLKTTDNNVDARAGVASKPDLRITGKQETIILAFKAENEKEAVRNFVRSNKFKLEMLKDETTLALKGYKSIYDEIR